MSGPASTRPEPAAAASRLPLVPAEELGERARRFARRLRADGLDGAFLLHPSSHFWLTGTLADGWPYVDADARVALPVRMSVNRAAAETSVPFAPVRRPADLPGVLAALGVPAGRTIGVELDVVPVTAYERLRRAFPDTEFRDVSRAIREVRSVKSAYELGWIRQAGALVTDVMDRALPPRLRADVPEIELCAFLEAELRARRHQGVVRVRRWNLEMHFGTVSAGASAAAPCYFDGPDGLEGLYPAVQQGGGERRIERGVPVLVDYVGAAGGYIADRARVVCVGEPPAEIRAAHGFCRELLAGIEAELRPGAVPSVLYADVLAKVAASPWADRFMGYGENRVGFVGHGVGLDLDEFPVLAPGFDSPLQAGQVLAVEPKVFFAEGAAGLENTYVVTESGGSNLTAGSEDILVVPPDRGE